MGKPTMGVVYVATSRDEKTRISSLTEVYRSAILLSSVSPNLKKALVATDDILKHPSIQHLFDYYIPSKYPQFNGYLASKIQALELSPFDLCLILDIDTLPVQDISRGFNFIGKDKRNIAIAIDSEQELRDKTGRTNYQNGVMFVLKCNETLELFNSWLTLLSKGKPKAPTRFIFSELLAISPKINIYTLSYFWNHRIDLLNEFDVKPEILSRILPKTRILHSHLIRNTAIQIFKIHSRYESISKLIGFNDKSPKQLPPELSKQKIQPITQKDTTPNTPDNLDITLVKGRLMKVLLVTDNPSWAYETKAQALLENYKGDKFSFSIICIKHNVEEVRKAFAESDLYIFFGFQNFKRCEVKFGVKRDKALVSIASHESWDKGLTQPTNQVLPDTETIDYLKTFRSISAVSYRLQLLFRMAGLAGTAYTPNGVLTDIFTPNYNDCDPNNLVCGYAGRDVDQKKGNRTIIAPAVSKVNNVSLTQAICDLKQEKKLGTRGEQCLCYEQMPEFYRNIDVYICASREEGSCRSVLEAMSSGCAILSTDSGSANELLVHNYNGLIFDRNAESLSIALTYLKNNKQLVKKMKERNKKIVSRYDWKIVAPFWYNWVKSVVS